MSKAPHKFDLQLTFDIPGFNEIGDDAAERGISAEQAAAISEAAKRTLEAGELWGTGLAPEWWLDYVELVSIHQWPWRVAVYIAWATVPKRERWPGTVEELASTVLGLKSPRVIFKWRKANPTIDAIVAIKQAAPLLENRALFYRELLEGAAKSGDDYKFFKYLQMGMEMLGDYVHKSQLDLGKALKRDDLAGMSDAELREWAGLAGDEEAEDAG